jgi:HD-GYP domain-containing protein (c-di-GMP phosphodiesterase class II)
MTNQPPLSDSLTANELAESLVGLMRQRDPQTAEHLDAVGNLSRRLAEELGYTGEQLDLITLAGRLHDIGKHTIPIDILLKPGALTAEEWVEMRLHPSYGASIISCFPPLIPVVEIVRMHHERPDGHGYPDGLHQSEIPMEARIVAVVDAFHAMTVTRPYSRAHSPTYAISELIAAAGAQFDPDCVEAFVTMMGARNIVLRAANDDTKHSA